LNKRINTKPLNVLKFLRILYGFCLKYFVVFLILGLFVLSYSQVQYIFSNYYILDVFIKKKGYSRKCLILLEDKDNIISYLHSFYKENNSSSVILPVFLNNMPKNFKMVVDSEQQKYVFINILLPFFVKMEKELELERQQVVHLSLKLLETPLSDEDYNEIRSLAYKYNVKIQNDEFWEYTQALEELLIRIDSIPISLSLAMAAKETGWGESRFLIEGNSLFSEWTFTENDGIVPLKRLKKAKHLVRKFSSLEDAIRAYYMNINTHNAYQRFRELRYKMRNDDSRISSTRLAYTLQSYSADPVNYPIALVSLINSNHLTQYDNFLSLSTDFNSTCLRIN
jgi:Bax protein